MKQSGGRGNGVKGGAGKGRRQGVKQREEGNQQGLLMKILCRNLLLCKLIQRIIFNSQRTFLSEAMYK